MSLWLKYRFCMLKRRIKSLMSEIDHERTTLNHRSNLYHDGRLNVDSLMEEYSKERMNRIYQIKKELVKLRQIDKSKSK